MDVGDSEGRCHGQLHLHAPLLSTRRFASLPQLNTKRVPDLDHGSDTSRRVPFLWERVPGTPKCSERQDLSADELPPPPPKLPPGRRLHLSKEGEGGNNDNDGDDDEGDDDDAYLDALDMMSFFESFGIEGSKSGVNRMHGLDSKAVQCSGNHSPSFIMNRFLPAANALAFASTSKNLNKNVPPHKDSTKRALNCQSTSEKLKVGMVSHTRRARSQSYSPPKSCGLLFFPWSVKHALCGLKSPVHSPSVKRKKHNPATDNESSGSKKSGKVDVPKCSEHVWNIPVFESPCESWLSHAVSSVHGKRG